MRRSSMKQYFKREMKFIVPGVVLAVALATVFSLVGHLVTSPFSNSSNATRDGVALRMLAR